MIGSGGEGGGGESQGWEEAQKKINGEKSPFGGGKDELFRPEKRGKESRRLKHTGKMM